MRRLAVSTAASAEGPIQGALRDEQPDEFTTTIGRPGVTVSVCSQSSYSA